MNFQAEIKKQLGHVVLYNHKDQSQNCDVWKSAHHLTEKLTATFPDLDADIKAVVVVELVKMMCKN